MSSHPLKLTLYFVIFAVSAVSSYVGVGSTVPWWHGILDGIALGAAIAVLAAIASKIGKTQKTDGAPKG
jgi:hypothetical protein